MRVMVPSSPVVKRMRAVGGREDCGQAAPAKIKQDGGTTSAGIRSTLDLRHDRMSGGSGRASLSVRERGGRGRDVRDDRIMDERAPADGVRRHREVIGLLSDDELTARI
jgi:hypothetical protein